MFTPHKVLGGFLLSWLSRCVIFLIFWLDLQNECMFFSLILLILLWKKYKSSKQILSLIYSNHFTSLAFFHKMRREQMSNCIFSTTNILGFYSMGFLLTCNWNCSFCFGGILLSPQLGNLVLGEKQETSLTTKGWNNFSSFIFSVRALLALSQLKFPHEEKNDVVLKHFTSKETASCWIHLFFKDTTVFWTI